MSNIEQAVAPADFGQVQTTDATASAERAADWLVARKVLPEPIRVTDHLAQL